MLLNCDRECRAGRAVAAPPRRRRPRGRGWAGLFTCPMPDDAGSDAHEHARWQSVQWLGRDGRGCSGPRRAPECAGARLPSGSGAGGGPCPQKTCPGIGRMCRSNPRPDRRPTLVTAAVQPRSRRPCNHGVTHGPGAADPGTLPQSNTQARDSDEPRRHHHAVAPSTHPCGGTAAAAAAAPRPP